MKLFCSGILFACAIALVCPMLLSSEEGLAATRFAANGDGIAGWTWLRDSALDHYAEWLFENIAPGPEPLIVDITALATNRVGGGRGFPAEFRLIYGFPGSGTMGGLFQTQQVTLPNVSSAGDPLGYTCFCQITIDRSAFPGATVLLFRIERDDPTANHIAFKKDSLVLRTSLPEDIGRQLVVVPPAEASQIGDRISGTTWCRKPSHVLEWRWNPIPVSETIFEAAVNLNLLVTNTSDGGSGYSAVVPVTLSDLSGRPLEVGTVEVANPFRPRSSANSRGIGYAASGAYVLGDPGLIKDGFVLKLSWPTLDPAEETLSAPRHFGGNDASALLAFVTTASAPVAIPPLVVSVGDILHDPKGFEGEIVRLKGEFYGWAGELADCPPPVTRSDWLIGEDGWYLYVTATPPADLSPGETSDYQTPLEVEGVVRVDLDYAARPCPYLEGHSVNRLEPPRVHVLTDEDNGQTIELSVGEKLQVHLEGNPSTGYYWERSDSLQEAILQPLGEAVFHPTPAPEGTAGVPGTFVIEFLAVSTGTTPFELSYRRPWEEAAIDVFSVTVVVE